MFSEKKRNKKEKRSKRRKEQDEQKKKYKPWVRFLSNSPCGLREPHKILPKEKEKNK